ncbi:MAG: protein ndvB, partial [Candidatus Binatus sp.]|nr:protein ndvB [Candidatus Binatus sp.]
MLRRFVLAYQRVHPLTIGELWALAITVRIVLVENLRRLGDRMVSDRESRENADGLADRLLGIITGTPELAVTALQDLAKSPLKTAFAVQLVQRLRDEDPEGMPALLWLDERLRSQGTIAEEIVQEEHQRQGAMNVTIRNIITSMRLMSALDWVEFFESVSLVDETLRAGSDFANMDFPTRDRYRRAIENLARGSKHSEIDVVRKVLLAANHAAADQQTKMDRWDTRKLDPGYYLIAGGRCAFERELGFHAPLKDWLKRANAVVGISGYLATIAFAAGLILALALLAVLWAGTGGWVLLPLAIFGLFVSTDAAITLVNRAVTNRFGPAALPGLELRNGVSAELRTIVVVPALLTTRTAVDELIERIEVHYLASSDGDLRFALLSDWIDSPTESSPGDEELLGAAIEGVARLNNRHGPAADGPRFFLLHRRRIWNESQGSWMGWERKRGKLHELNRLLRGANDTTFQEIGGGLPLVPPGVRYVITLDADTRLPMGAAKRLIGKMAHPLNRPRLDPDCGRVVEGYGVLQPRVTPSLPTSQEGSIFQRVFSTASGIDPYASAVSDVYQDLFEQGSYSGKGIYDLDVFEAALEGRIPENTVLSHDLLEGIFARAGLVSDVEVFEDFPSRYDVAAARQHRWARGDWQLLPWIIGANRNFGNRREQTVIPLLGRWKLVDNLRRTLSAPAAFLAILAGCSLLPTTAALVWCGFVLFALSLPAMLPLLARVIPGRYGITPLSHLRAFRSDLKLAVLQFVLQVTLLAHQSWLMVDAIVRTLFRLFARRRLLEWVAAAQATFDQRLRLFGFYRRMAGAVALAASGAVILAYSGRNSWLIGIPFFGAWMLSPAMAWWVSRVPPLNRKPLSDSDSASLRLVARRTWGFFETFVTAEEHMLPPDNFQETPKPVLAHRTSPTNIGLYLLSVLAARDFGWLGITAAVDRLEETFCTMNKLDRYRGHFFNWYDTRNLHPLEPKYVSAIDSGNLAGHLIA